LAEKVDVMGEGRSLQKKGTSPTDDSRMLVRDRLRGGGPLLGEVRAVAGP
jgi:hypothetical protein